jgi:uncharacterized phage protein gp47/JayE
MAYTSPTESQIVANLINTYVSLAASGDDINPGSALRSAFEAFAQELKKLYQNIGDAAAETQKSAAYTMFNFPLFPAQAAYTMVTLTAAAAPASNIPVPAGTTVAVKGTSIQYKTPAIITWPSGSATVSARVVCSQTGSSGNQRAGTITQLVTNITGIPDVTVTNPQAVITGSNIETSDQRANRFQQWINSLHRGDKNALVYGAKQAQLVDAYGYISERVMKAQLIEGVGSNTIYVDNGFYGASSDLISRCQNVIDGYIDSSGNVVVGYKAAGITTTVITAALQNITITVTAMPKPGYTFTMIQQSIIDSITDLAMALDVGESLTMAALNLAIGNTPGVLNYQIPAPTADVIPPAGTLLKLGSLQPAVSTA